MIPVYKSWKVVTKRERERERERGSVGRVLSDPRLLNVAVMFHVVSLLLQSTVLLLKSAQNRWLSGDCGTVVLW